MPKLNPWIKVGAGLVVGARLAGWLMAAVETAAERLFDKRNEHKPEPAEKATQENTEDTVTE